MIEYNGERKYFNESSVQSQPSDSLVSKMAQLTAYCKEIAHHHKVINVGLDEASINFMRGY